MEGFALFLATRPRQIMRRVIGLFEAFEQKNKGDTIAGKNKRPEYVMPAELTTK